jgi:putative two-component system response regulator
MNSTTTSEKIIFVVDDNNTNLLTAKAALSGQYKVFSMADAETMFELLEDITPDLILLDIEMPVMDGFDVLKALKADKEYEGIPVIFMTSRTDDVTKNRGFEMGVVDFIGKPFTNENLMNYVNKNIAV